MSNIADDQSAVEMEPHPTEAALREGPHVVVHLVIGAASGAEIAANRLSGSPNRTEKRLNASPWTKPRSFPAAFGLIVPPAIHFLPWLAPLAAAGLVIVMAGAVVRHAQQYETPMVPVVAVLGVLAALTVYLRVVVVPL